MKFEIEVSNYDESSIESRIVEAVIGKFHDTMTSIIKDEVKSRLNKVIQQKAEETVDREVTAILTEGIQKTNQWGEPTHGVKLTIKQLFLDKCSDRDYRREIERTLDNFLNKELKTEMEAMRQEIRSKWTSKVKDSVLKEVKKHVEDLPI